MMSALYARNHSSQKMVSVKAAHKVAKVVQMKKPVKYVDTDFIKMLIRHAASV